MISVVMELWNMKIPLWFRGACLVVCDPFGGLAECLKCITESDSKITLSTCSSLNIFSVLYYRLWSSFFPLGFLGPQILN